MLHCNQSSAVIFARCDSLHILHSSVALPTHVFVCAGVTGAQATRKRNSRHVPMMVGSLSHRTTLTRHIFVVVLSGCGRVSVRALGIDQFHCFN